MHSWVCQLATQHCRHLHPFICAHFNRNEQMLKKWKKINLILTLSSATAFISMNFYERQRIICNLCQIRVGELKKFLFRVSAWFRRVQSRRDGEEKGHEFAHTCIRNGTKKKTAYIINFMLEISRWIIFMLLMLFCSVCARKKWQKWPKNLIYSFSFPLFFWLFPVTSVQMTGEAE